MRQADWCKQHTTLHANIVDFVFYKKKKLKSAPIYQTDNFPKTKVTVKDTNSSIFFFQTKIIIQIMWPKQSIGGLGLASKYDKKLLYHIGNILAQVISMKLCCFANTSSH